MRTYLLKRDAARALGAALATFDPEHQPGEPLDPDVVTIGQALGLLPYDSLVDTTGMTRNENRSTAMWRRPVLVEDEADMPALSLKMEKFS